MHRQIETSVYQTHHAGIQPSFATLADGALSPAKEDEALNGGYARPRAIEFLQQQELGLFEEVFAFLETGEAFVVGLGVAAGMRVDHVEEEGGAIWSAEDGISIKACPRSRQQPSTQPQHRRQLTGSVHGVMQGSLPRPENLEEHRCRLFTDVAIGS